MGEGEGVSYLDLSLTGTPVLLGSVGTTTCFGSPPCPYLAPDWATDVKEPGWFRNKNSRGLAESSFWAPERLAPDPAVVQRPGWRCWILDLASSLRGRLYGLAPGHSRGQEPNRADERIPSRKAGASPREPGPGAGT